MLKVKLKLSNGESVYDEVENRKDLVDNLMAASVEGFYTAQQRANGQLVYVNIDHVVTVKAFDKELPDGL